MAARETRPNKPAVKIRQPKKGSKAEAILTLATTTRATNPQIAQSVSTTRQVVHNTLERYGINSRSLENFKETKADYYAAAQMLDLDVYLNMSTEERQKRIKTRGLVDAGIAFDKEAAERSKNIDGALKVMDLIQRVKQMDEGC
jgi:hypothetical protein